MNDKAPKASRKSRSCWLNITNVVAAVGVCAIIVAAAPIAASAHAGGAGGAGMGAGGGHGSGGQGSHSSGHGHGNGPGSFCPSNKAECRSQ